MKERTNMLYGFLLVYAFLIYVMDAEYKQLTEIYERALATNTLNIIPTEEG